MATREDLCLLAALPDLDALADPDAGFVQRAVYVDRNVYDLELERIFARAWLYLAHVSAAARTR